jgi:hypothetical protein
LLQEEIKEPKSSSETEAQRIKTEAKFPPIGKRTLKLELRSMEYITFRQSVFLIFRS